MATTSKEGSRRANYPIPIRGSNSRANTCINTRLHGRVALVIFQTGRRKTSFGDSRQESRSHYLVGDSSIEFLPYQLDCSVLDYNGDNG